MKYKKHNNSGQAMTEYIILVVFLSVLLIGVVNNFGKMLKEDTYKKVADARAERLDKDKRVVFSDKAWTPANKTPTKIPKWDHTPDPTSGIWAVNYNEQKHQDGGTDYDKYKVAK